MSPEGISGKDWQTEGDSPQERASLFSSVPDLKSTKSVLPACLCFLQVVTAAAPSSAFDIRLQLLQASDVDGRPETPRILQSFVAY